MKIKTEQAQCKNCLNTFSRRAGRSNPARYCARERCQKIKNLKNTVASFDTLPKPHTTEYTADIQYYGRPNA